ncbi:hypothetical protein ACWT_1169 [Actinoplanes sp. SE50]|uniref:hypothetical protein n=1 Tax=unclassified Actinoplanes TaxID=2626549 RepID=UPI00023ED1AC|nr:MULTISPECIES: hypothetical protein [unclassified Actinoplanes]AEV82185.1 hypothetical protein ACPL_1288 [Actinoplanes sp. SE50/110]ATO80584.1 hypothetical protein ACWT_1169 [Actinoplanes sp. SE50]SLL97990.1 hypothetical protein ACSP50_1206 [Actinoplanes sp. SE50/110]
MRLSLRWRLAFPLTVLTLLLFVATAGGLWLYWEVDSPARRALTAFMCLMLGITVGISVSIAIDRRIESVPWLRMGAIVVFVALTTGVAWVRTMF